MEHKKLLVEYPSVIPPELNIKELPIAANIAILSVPVVTSDEDVSTIRRKLKEQSYECLSHIVVCDALQLVGVIRIEDLFSANEEAKASDVMDHDPPIIKPGVDKEIVAWTAVHHKESALIVVNKKGEFKGLIPPYLLLGVLLKEHEEDLSRLGGFLQGAYKARAALQEPVLKRFWHRMPWLLLGLIGAFIAAKIISGYEAKLQEQLTIAFFIPGIVYLADAVGTQTETIIVRGLSVGVSIRRALWQELITGIAIGVMLAVIAYPFLVWNWNDGALALATSLALFLACSTATIIAMTLPVLFNIVDIDPAYGSGPIATVIQDVLSILIYFVIVANIMF